MSVATGVAARCVTRYASLLHSAIGPRHHVASPLGAWLLLALAGPAAEGRERQTLTEVLGCDIGQAASMAAELLHDPHPRVGGGAAVWTEDWADLSAGFRRWCAQLPAEVTRGPLPDQAGLDSWARDHTLGLIDSFPVRRTDDLYLLLATALATRVSWQFPFELAPASSLGPASPWAGQLGQVLHTPAAAASGHEQFISSAPEAGDVVVHAGTATGGLLVVSVAALPQVTAADVLAAAHRIGCALATGEHVVRRELADLPLGEAPLWLMREEMSMTSDACIAVLPAWSARSDHELTEPALGFQAAVHALVGPRDPWHAKQAVLARYTRTGFEAAAVSAVGVMLAAMPTRRRRVAELRFGHPYAVVALTLDDQGTARGAAQSPWHGLPVFSAWVATPEEP